MERGVFGSCAEAMADEELFRDEIVHSSIPGFADLVAAKDWDGCSRLLGDRMRSKPAPSFSPFLGKAEGGADPLERTKADVILEDVFTLPDSRGGRLRVVALLRGGTGLSPTQGLPLRPEPARAVDGAGQGILEDRGGKVPGPDDRAADGLDQTCSHLLGTAWERGVPSPALAEHGDAQPL